MNTPLTVALMIIMLFSAVVGVFIANALIIPHLASRRVALVAAGCGAVALIALYLAAVLTEGYLGLVLVTAPMIIIAVCATGAVKQAIYGFRHNSP